MTHPGPVDAESDELDHLFDVLSHPYRRRVLTRLRDGADRNDDALAPEALRDAPADPDHLRTELHHVHLPKLDDASYVRWDRDADTVRRGNRFDDVAPLIDILDDDRDERSRE